MRDSESHSVVNRRIRVLATEILATRTLGRGEETLLSSGWTLIGSELSSPNFNSLVRAERSFAIRYLNVVIKPLCGNLETQFLHTALGMRGFFSFLMFLRVSSNLTSLNCIPLKSSAADYFKYSNSFPPWLGCVLKPMAKFLRGCLSRQAFDEYTNALMTKENRVDPYCVDPRLR